MPLLPCPLSAQEIHHLVAAEGAGLGERRHPLVVAGRYVGAVAQQHRRHGRVAVPGRQHERDIGFFPAAGVHRGAVGQQQLDERHVALPGCQVQGRAAARERVDLGAVGQQQLGQRAVTADRGHVEWRVVADGPGPDRCPPGEQQARDLGLARTGRGVERCHTVERRAGVDRGAAVEEMAHQLDIAGRRGLVEQAVVGRDLGTDRGARQREQNRKGDGSASRTAKATAARMTQNTTIRAPAQPTVRDATRLSVSVI